MLLGGRKEREDELAGESVHVVKVKKRILCMVFPPCVHRCCGC